VITSVAENEDQNIVPKNSDVVYRKLLASSATT